MKTILTFLFSCFINLLNAQDSTEIKLINKKWIGESYEIHGRTKILLEEYEKGFFLFSSDKTCEVGFLDEEIEKGTWSYNPETKKISIWLISTGFMQYIKIIEITKDKFIIEVEKDEQKIKGTLIAKE